MGTIAIEAKTGLLHGVKSKNWATEKPQISRVETDFDFTVTLKRAARSSSSDQALIR